MQVRDTWASLSQFPLGHSNVCPSLRPCMSDLEGPEAVRLFVEIVSGTKRDPDVDMTGDAKKYLLPTKEKLERVLGNSDGTVLSLLCCPCTLCDHDNDDFRNLVQGAKILHDTQKRQELAILILSGCLFALGDLCKQANFDVVKFAAQVNMSWTQHSTDSCFLRIAPIPSQCPHRYLDQDKCAALESSTVVNVPNLERTPVIFDHSSQNVPFILECPQERLNMRLTPRFYTSQIDPSCCGDEQLREQVLFRKVFKYQHERVGLIVQAEEEARIAMHLAQRDPASFVEVYFALTYKDRLFTYVEIVFPLYDRNLSHEFELQELPRRSAPELECLLHNPLWTASLNVVNAVHIMHEAVESGDVKCSGHFDIKPDNIVVKDDQDGTKKLFLIDFGQAAAQQAGTNYYQPPEVTWPRPNANPLKTKYDVWSMACVLLEVLIFIDSGLDRLQLFRARVKGNDEPNFAFWQGTSPQEIVLRPAVTDRLRTFEDQGNRRIQPVIRLLRAMLSIFPEQRPTMRSCLGDLTRLNLNPEDLGLATQDWMNCGLEKWKTSYSTSRIVRPTPGDLYFYRDKPSQDHQGGVEQVTLHIESVMRDSQPLKAVSFVPRAFFHFSTRPGHTFTCHFDNFHTGFTFYFSLLREFLDFMSLLTYQQIVPDIAADPAASEVGFKVGECLIKERGMFRDSTRRFKGGTVQIWRQLSQGVYDRWVKRPESLGTTAGDAGLAGGMRTASSTAVASIRNPTNVWKMVLWTQDAMTNERVCVVIDIGAKTWRLDDPSGRAPRCFKIKPHHGHADFRGAIFTPSTPKEDRNVVEDRYPGFPISPSRLQAEMQLRLTQATIDFLDPDHRKQILQILRQNNFNLAG
ncbi:serine/threonine protein kinase [Seiridium cupressi]